MFYFNTLNLNQISGGNQVKQGDFGSTFTYNLADEKGRELDVFDKKTAYVNLVLDNNIVFTTTVIVDGSTVTFNIDKAIPTGLYFIEIKIDNYIFPSDRQTIILVTAGAVAYDLKELVPNYDINMTIKGILSDLSQKGIDISDLKTKMKAIYNNALADHAEVAKARGYANTLVERLDQMEQTDKSTAQDVSVVSGQINNLIANAGNGTVPSELIDMRVANDGMTYSTAGQAVRTSGRASNATFTALLNSFAVTSLLTATSSGLYGYTISSLTPTLYTTGGAGNSYSIYDVSLIDFVKLTMTTAGSGSIYNVIFTDAENKIITSEKNTSTISKYIKVFTVPVGAKNLIVSYRNGSTNPQKAEAVTIDVDKISKLSTIDVGKIDGSTIDVDKIEGSNIPQYYKNHLESKISQIHSLEEEIGADGDIFGFITDIHQPSNSMNSSALLGEIKKRTNLKVLIDGGDNAYGSSSVVNTLSKCKEEIRDVTESFNSNFGTGILKLVGNHDNNGYGATYQGQEFLSKKAEYSLMMKAQENIAVFNQNDKLGMYSYFDNVEQKIRYILLSTEEIDVVRHGFSVNQTSWLINTALKFPSAGWSVAVFTHQPISESWSFRFIRNVLTALNAGTTYSYHDTEIAGAEYHFECDFTGDKQANVLFCASGHIHKDTTKIVSGIVYFTTTCDAHYNDDYANLGYKRDVGTIYEQAFDIIAINKNINRIDLVRVGAGSNRSFVYGSAPQILV